MPRKTRSDARLPKLTKEQRDMLLFWLDDQNLKLSIVVTMIYDEFGIRTNKSSVSNWYSSYCFSRDVRAASELAGTLREELENLPVAMDSELISQVTQARFESQVAKDGDLGGHVALRKLRQKDQDQRLAQRTFEASIEGFKLKFEQKERELALQLEKFKRQTCEMFLQWVNDERAKAITSSGATNAEKIEQLGQAMFGEDWHE